VLLVDRLEPRGGLAVGGQRVVVLGANPADTLGHLHDLAPERLGLGAERGHRALEAQHPLDIVPEAQRALDLVAQVAHRALNPIDLLPGAREPLGLPLGLGEAGAQRLEALDLPLDGDAALPQRVQFGRPFHDRSQCAELFRGGFRAGDEGFELRGDVLPVLVHRDHGVIIAASTFQERDHGLTPGVERGSFDRVGLRAVVKILTRGGPGHGVQRVCPRPACTGVDAFPW
jgi:hypothetical protein